MRTSCSVHMEFIDTSAIADATIITSGNVSFGDLGLFSDLTTQKDYGTLELNQFVLDGSKQILPVAAQDVAYWSDSSSDEECSFAEETWLKIDFTKPHTSAGIKLYFIGEYPEAVKITWYSLAGSKLAEDCFYPDCLEYFCDKQVEGYGKIEITFLSTTLPERYVKLQYIKYGVELDWSCAEIIRASVAEELDATGATLAINTADIAVADQDRAFDPSVPDGRWKSVQKSQTATITETIDGVDHGCGVFYIDSHDWKENAASFRLIDRIGYMDRTYFYNGRIYDNEPAGIIIAEIMESAGIEDYTVDEEIAAIQLSGYLGIQTHRSALQQVVFACGAVADCSRTGTVRIYAPGREIRSSIGTDRKFLGASISLDEYISGVSISYNRYTRSEDTTEIYNGEVPAGDYRIEFGSPYDPESLTVSSGTIVEAKTNYMVIHCDAAGECVVTGYGYDVVENTYTAKADHLDAGEVESIKSYTACTLINSARVPKIAEHILNYLQLRQIVTMEYLNMGEIVGQWVNIMDRNQNACTTGITSQTIDLTGGNVASVTCRGYSRVVTAYHYCGEFYSGEGAML